MKRLAFALLFCLSANVFAAPINYTTLQNNTPALGEISPFSNAFDPATAQYFRFFLNGSRQVTITGARIDAGYDMGLWLFSGLFTDTTQFGPFFDLGDAPVSALRDDQIPFPGGPFGDPQFIGTLNAGWYTLAVVNVSSNGNTGPDNMYDFRLTASNITGSVPAPDGLTLLGLGLVAVGFARRRN